MGTVVTIVNNRSLLHEIWLSKLSYCEIYSDEDRRAIRRGILPDHFKVDAITDDLATVTEPGLTVRLVTQEHIPLAEEESRGKGLLGHLDGVCFQPFVLYRSEVGHNSGDIVFRPLAKAFFDKGEFNPTKGRLTDNLAMQLSRVVARYSSKGNWRGYSYVEEMSADALVTLMDVILRFDEARSVNPFAYITTTLTNAFTRRFNTEKKQQTIRDDLMEMAGAKPSMTRQLVGVLDDRAPSPVRHIKVGDREQMAAIFASRIRPKRGRPPAK